MTARDHKGRHPEKNVPFDILSLADQLHQSKSTIPEGPEPGKIYFSENEATDLLNQGIEHLRKSIDLYNLLFIVFRLTDWAKSPRLMLGFVLGDKMRHSNCMNWGTETEEVSKSILDT